MATAPRSRQEAPPRCLRRSIADAIARYPALLGRGGVFRQAILGLSENASASLPRPRLRAAVPPRPARLGAARRGGTSKAKATAQQHQQQKRHFPTIVIPAKAGIQGPKRCTPLPTPHPLPQGERGLEARKPPAFDVAFAFDSPPRCLRRAPQSRSDKGPRVCSRGARQDAEDFTHRPWMACG